MKARDIFGLVIRSVALYLFIWGAWNTLAGFKFLPATIIATLSNQTLPTYNSVDYWVYGMPAFFGGLFVLRFAETLVRSSYREPRPAAPVAQLAQVAPVPPPEQPN